MSANVTVSPNVRPLVISGQFSFSPDFTKICFPVGDATAQADFFTLFDDDAFSALSPSQVFSLLSRCAARGEAAEAVPKVS